MNDFFKRRRSSNCQAAPVVTSVEERAVKRQKTRSSSSSDEVPQIESEDGTSGEGEQKDNSASAGYLIDSSTMEIFENGKISIYFSGFGRWCQNF
jgi:hypothetical protein